jgi:hypothetical protein
MRDLFDEYFQSCVKAEYTQHESSQIVHTAWALATLARAQWPDRAPLDKAANVWRDIDYMIIAILFSFVLHENDSVHVHFLLDS